MNCIERTRKAWMRALLLLFAFACAGQAAAQAWTELAPSGPATPAREAHTAVYDAAGNRMIVFGGFTGSSALNDVWVLSNANGKSGTPEWTQLAPSGAAPSARYEHTAVYDAAGNRMIVFGGNNGGLLNEVWVLSNANGKGGTPAWTQLAPSGTAPAARKEHTAVYDAASNRMIVFAGYSGGYLNDVWVLSNANGSGGTPAWTQLTPSGTAPPVRRLHTAVYAAAGNRMIVFGGLGGGVLNDVWVLSNANGSGGAPAWALLTPSGTAPSARYDHSAVYSAAGNRMIVFGGYNGNDLNDVWVLSNANANGSGGPPAWRQLAPSGSAPPAREYQTAVYVPAGGRMIVFGGCSFSGCPLNDVWLLSGVGSIPVAIDIRPRVAINMISRTNGTTVPVAILSSASFSALAEVNRTSLTFGHAGTEATLIHCGRFGLDVNADGYMDLVCQFNATLGGFQIGDSTGYLRGTTLQGNTIHGSDSVLITQ